MMDIVEKKKKTDYWYKDKAFFILSALFSTLFGLRYIEGNIFFFYPILEKRTFLSFFKICVYLQLWEQIHNIIYFYFLFMLFYFILFYFP
jgi:hypothetical protein